MQLPDILKYKPKQFWSMLKPRDDDITALKLEEFTEHNRTLFHNPNLPDEEYTPVTKPATQHITPEELKYTLQHAFKANRSSGLSDMPLQVLKHLSVEGIERIAELLNKSAID